jgi:hypothetical protein
MLYIVCATVALTKVITKTPRKLQTAAMMIALRGEIDLVEIQVAIALGASVHPLTIITAKTKTTTINSNGLVNNCDIKSVKYILIFDPLNIFITQILHTYKVDCHDSGYFFTKEKAVINDDCLV